MTQVFQDKGAEFRDDEIQLRYGWCTRAGGYPACQQSLITGDNLAQRLKHPIDKDLARGLGQVGPQGVGLDFDVVCTPFMASHD